MKTYIGLMLLCAASNACTSAAASNCNQSGVPASVAGCYVTAVSGVTHYTPYF